MTFGIPKRLNNHDAFRIMKDTPTNIKIIKFDNYSHGDLSRENNYYRMDFILKDTGQTVSYPYKVVWYSSMEPPYYIGFDHELYPILSFASGIKNNAIEVYPEDLKGLAGLEFKATVKTQKVKPSFRKLHYFNEKNTIIPVIGGQTRLSIHL